jgi:MFS family permease
MSGFSTSFGMLLFFRLVTGMGTACVASTSISLIAEVFPRAYRGVPLALNTTFIYIGATIGPGLGGIITELMGWEWIFIFIIPICIAGLIPMLLFKRDFVVSRGEPFDIKGTLLYGSGIVTLMYGVSHLPDTIAIMCIAAGIVMLIAFVNFETREEYPVLSVRLFKEKTFRRSCIAAFLNYGATYAIVFTMSIYLQQVCGLNPGHAGMIVLIQPLVQTIVTPFAGRMSDKMDPRILTTAGMLCVCISTGLMMTLTIELNMVKVALTFVFSGLGYALFSTANTNVIMGSVSEKNYSDASGMVSVMRQVGMMASLAVVMCIISVLMGTGTAVAPDMFDTFMRVVRYAFSICFTMAFIGVFVAWFSNARPMNGGSDVPHRSKD